MKTENHGQVNERQPSAVMAFTQLEAAFPQIPFITLEQLFRECGENVNTVLDHLTTTQLQQPLCTMTVDDTKNLDFILNWLVWIVGHAFELCNISF